MKKVLNVFHTINVIDMKKILKYIPILLLLLINPFLDLIKSNDIDKVKCFKL